QDARGFVGRGSVQELSLDAPRELVQLLDHHFARSSRRMKSPGWSHGAKAGGEVSPRQQSPTVSGGRVGSNTPAPSVSTYWKRGFLRGSLPRPLLGSRISRTRCGPMTSHSLTPLSGSFTPETRITSSVMMRFQRPSRSGC